MNSHLLKEMMAATPLQDFGQKPEEWKIFMEIVSAYFQARGIDHPVVVEIGIWKGHQKKFYERILGAEYIGIDQDPKSPADIVGDSRDPQVKAALLSKLSGRGIDLLFIDGDHTLEGVSADYQIFGPLARHIIAIHDIATDWIPEEKVKVKVKEFWNWIKETDHENTLIEIHRFNHGGSGQFQFNNLGRQMGIGMVMANG
jgi:hypothetical protein